MGKENKLSPGQAGQEVCSHVCADRLQEYCEAGVAHMSIQAFVDTWFTLCDQ